MLCCDAAVIKERRYVVSGVTWAGLVLHHTTVCPGNLQQPHLSTDISRLSQRFSLLSWHPDILTSWPFLLFPSVNTKWALSSPLRSPLVARSCSCSSLFALIMTIQDIHPTPASFTRVRIYISMIENISRHYNGLVNVSWVRLPQ